MGVSQSFFVFVQIILISCTLIYSFVLILIFNTLQLLRNSYRCLPGLINPVRQSVHLLLHGDEDVLHRPVGQRRVRDVQADRVEVEGVRRFSAVEWAFGISKKSLFVIELYKRWPN